ncbi:MAG: hypothetical protein V4528_15240, partial [Pseudomonadota bacterium]
MYSVIPWPWCRDGVAVAGVDMVLSPLIENKPKSLPLFCLLTFFIIGPAFVFCWCCCCDCCLLRRWCCLGSFVVQRPADL